MSAVGEEDYSTPAASEGGSDYLTNSSRSATAAGFDPLGMVRAILMSSGAAVGTAG